MKITRQPQQLPLLYDLRSVNQITFAMKNFIQNFTNGGGGDPAMPPPLPVICCGQYDHIPLWSKIFKKIMKYSSGNSAHDCQKAFSFRGASPVDPLPCTLLGAPPQMPIMGKLLHLTCPPFSSFWIQKCPMCLKIAKHNIINLKCKWLQKKLH